MELSEKIALAQVYATLYLGSATEAVAYNTAAASAQRSDSYLRQSRVSLEQADLYRQKALELLT